MNFQSAIFDGEFSKVLFWRVNFQSTILKGQFSKYYFERPIFKVLFWRVNFQSTILEGEFSKAYFERPIFSLSQQQFRSVFSGSAGSRDTFDRRIKVWDPHTRPRGKANAIYLRHIVLTTRPLHPTLPAAATSWPLLLQVNLDNLAAATAGQQPQQSGRCYCRPSPTSAAATAGHQDRRYRPAPTDHGRCYCRPLTASRPAAATLQATHDVRQLSATAGPYDDDPATVSHNVRPLYNVRPSYNVRPLQRRRRRPGYIDDGLATLH